MKALIFGGSGQDGFYLSKICREQGFEPVIISRRGGHVQADVPDGKSVEGLIFTHHPELIFHLVASSTTRHDTLSENHAAIATGTLNILESVRKHFPNAKVFIPVSGVQFENHGKPISENDAFSPTSAHAVSRIYSVYAARYFRKMGIKVYVGYLFHHESPQRKTTHVSQKIAQLACRVAQGNTEICEIGDLSVRKEWTFAGDIARGIFTLLSQGSVFEAVIGSGKTCSIVDWVKACFEVVGKNWRDHIREQESFQPEYRYLCSNPSTIKSLGWEPAMSFSQLASLMVPTGSFAQRRAGKG